MANEVITGQRYRFTAIGRMKHGTEKDPKVIKRLKQKVQWVLLDENQNEVHHFSKENCFINEKGYPAIKSVTFDEKFVGQTLYMTPYIDEPDINISTKIVVTKLSNGLTFTCKTSSAKQKVQDNLNVGVGNSGIIAIDERGKVIINISDPQEKQLTTEQKAFFDIVKESVEAEGTLEIKVVESNEKITFGSFSKATIDIDDINALGQGEAMNQNSVLAHEIKEQFEKQVNGKDRPEAHAAGEKAEVKITGYTREQDSKMRNEKIEKVVKRRRIGTETFYTSSGIKEYNFKKGSTSITIVTEVSRRNIVKVTRKKQ